MTVYSPPPPHGARATAAIGTLTRTFPELGNFVVAKYNDFMDLIIVPFLINISHQCYHDAIGLLSLMQHYRKCDWRFYNASIKYMLHPIVCVYSSYTVCGGWARVKGFALGPAFPPQLKYIRLGVCHSVCACVLHSRGPIFPHLFGQ